MTFTRTNFEESIIIKMFTIPLLYCENIITTEKYKLQFKPRRSSNRVSLVYTLLFSYNCMIAKVLSKIYHAMSKTKPKQTKYSAAQSLMHRQNTTTTNPHFSLTKYTSAFVYFLSKIHRIWNHMQQSCKQVKYLFLWVYYIEILFIIQKMCFLFNF